MRLPTRHGAARVFVCLACLATGLRAQQLEQPRATFQTGVNVVQVDVSVLDKDRKPLRGLTDADFTIREDGKPRPIVAFVPVDLAEREASPARASWMRDVSPDVTTNDVRPEGRLVVIMFDWSIRLEDQVLARRIATAAVDALGPDDLAAVVFSSAFANGGTPQNFTADRARLLAAINRPFAVALINAPVGPFHDPRNKNNVMIDDPEGYETGDCLCRVCVPETIARVADAVRDVRGRRKTLLFIGTYFRSFENLQGPVTLQGGSGGFLLGARGTFVRPGVCSAPLKDARNKMVQATSLANLTIHALDPVGLETEGNSPVGGSIVGQLERRDDLAVLADLTGGRTVLNTSAPEEHVPAIFAESQSYYLLGFAPADGNANGRFHKIEVKVNRPGASVRTRAGYYAGETRPADRKPTAVSPGAAAALDGVLPRTDVPLSVSVAPFAMPGKAESAVVIVLGVRQEVPTDRSDRSGPVKVLAAAFDRNGRSIQSEEQTVAVTWHPDAAGNSSYEVVSRLALKPGRYEVRVAVETAASRRASVFTFVDVPDFEQQPLSLSGIVLAVSPSVPSAPPDAFTNVLPVVPTARRDLARTDRATAFARVYQNAKNVALPATLTARIVDTSDRLVLSEVKSLTAEGFVGNRGADYRLDLPVERLEGGEYLLTIETAQGKYTARRGMRFTVRSSPVAATGL